MATMDYSQLPKKLNPRPLLLLMGTVIQGASWCEAPQLFDAQLQQQHSSRALELEPHYSQQQPET